MLAMKKEKQVSEDTEYLSTGKNEGQYIAILDRISDGVLSLDEDLHYTYANKKITELTGIPNNKLIGHYIWDVFPAVVGTETYHAINRAIKEQVYVCNTDFFPPFNLWQENHIYPSKEGLTIFVRDISDKKNAEIALIKSEEHYRTLFQNLIHAFAYCKLIYEGKKIVDFSHLYVNRAYQTIVGPNDPAGKKASEFFLNFKTDFSNYLDILNRLDHDGKPETTEHFVATSSKWYSLTLYSPDKDHVVFLIDEITEKKKFNEQQGLFASIVSFSKDAIFSKDLDGFITSWNEAAELLFGYPSKEAIGMHVKNLIPTNLLYECDDVIAKISEGKNVRELETTRLQKNGTQISISLSISPILASDGHISGASIIARDITEKKATEEKIRNSESNLNTIIENSTECFVLTDKHLSIKAFNQKASESILFQFGAGKIKEGAPFLNYIHTERKEVLKATLNRVLNGEVIQYESDFYKKNGAPHWFHTSFIPVMEKNEVSGICVAVRDITAQKSHEKKLLESEENLKAVFENTTQGFILVELDGTIKLFNQNATKFGFSAYGREMEVGKSLYDFIEPSRISFLKEAVHDVLLGETIQYSRLYEKPNAKNIWLDFSITSVKTGNKTTGICITGNDITEKKITEQEREFDQRNLQSLINNTSDLMWSIDTDFRLITSNAPFSNLTKSLSGVAISPGSTVLVKEFGKDMMQRYKDYYKRAFSGESFSVVEQNTFAELSWAEISFYPIYKHKEVIGTACFARDITERVTTEELLKKNADEKEILIQELSQNNKDLKQFAYITSHNLRGPIANLLGLTSLLDKYKVKSPTLNQILGGVKKAALRFDETIKDLTSILTIKDNVSIPQEILLFKDSFEKALSQCEAIFEEYQAEVFTDFKAREVSFNKSYLESIFLNLITNSLKYRDYSRPPKISISTRTEGDHLIMEYADNGIGIDLEANKDKIFKLYQRFHSSREGKGLGLFLVKSQLEALGATIELESELDKGVHFTIIFKAVKKQSQHGS